MQSVANQDVRTRANIFQESQFFLTWSKTSLLKHKDGRQRNSKITKAVLKTRSKLKLNKKLEPKRHTALNSKRKTWSIYWAVS